MTLMLKLSRDMAKFEVSDDDAETVVSISPGDGEAAMIRKLKRVIALVEGEQAPALTGMAKAVADFGARAKADAVTGGPRYVDASPVPPQTGNGWAAVYGPPELPEDRKGDWELVQPGEGE